RQADKYGVPRICFINKMDKLGADFKFSFKTIHERLGANAVPVQIPIGAGSEFKGIIDLMEMKAYYFDASEMGSTVEQREIPDDLRSEADQWHHDMVEKIAELDEALTEQFIMEQEISEADLRAALRQGTIDGRACPTLCGSALRYIGVQRLVDAIIDYLPAPTEVADVRGTDPRDKGKELTRPLVPDAPFSALVFKVVSDSHGDLTYTRIYSGVLEKGTRVINPGNGKKEIISRIYQMHAKDRTAMDKAQAGDIVALIGLKHSTTGDTLCDPGDQIILERMEFPDPVISMSIEPESAGDREKLGAALLTINREDPSLRFNVDEETGETIIAGMGELHLDIIQTKLTRDMKVPVVTGKPRVSYRESITGAAEARGRHKKQTGGRGQFGDCVLAIEPCTAEQAEEQELKYRDGLAFENKISGGAIPREYIPSVETGVRRTAVSGVLAGYPLQGVKVALIDGSYHEVDSSQVAFEAAGILAFKEAVKKAKPILLEPIMNITVTTPDDFVGNVTGDLSSRRGMILGQEQRGNVTMISAEAPLSEMFGYVNQLRGMTQGRASYTMEPGIYREVPRNLAEDIIAGKL
ncbi:MAG: elongation factor G, partial [Phycisphaerae bacterium]|nr:elongation factor G [Phycisphaerae bacterium]